MGRRIHICCDSRAVLAPLAQINTESSLVWECIQVLGRICEFNVTSVFIPGHQEKPANEEADRPAKEGAVEVPPNQFTAIHFSIGKNSSRSICNGSIRPGGLPVLAADSPKC